MNPILDQPQTIDTDQLPSDLGYRLANQDLVFYADAATDLVDLTWPWAGETYVRRVQLRIVALREDEMAAMVTRFYPGYQEVILGNEGMIVSKRLCALLNSPYDRSVLWALECQAEGDRLLRLEIDIEWAEPLTQRMVDGLLVAQRNPQPARGIYAQSNAESTCVFGNPYGRPDGVEIDDPQRAKLVYHVLVNGVVEVPLLLTVSDVGEQMAWNGFLALRDTERAFELSVRAWDELLRAGRLWTPHARYNQAVQMGKTETVRRVQRLRTGYAPSDRDLRHLPALVESLDAIDVTQSRNLLAHARRLAERSDGRLPVTFPLRMQDPISDPGAALVETNGAYLMALSEHLRHHFDAGLLDEHYAAVRACADALIQHRWQALTDNEGAALAAISGPLRRALGLAVEHHDSVNMVRWESEVCEMERQVEALGLSLPKSTFDAERALQQSAWQMPAEHPWHFAEPWQGVALAGQAIWRGCGVSRERNRLTVYPTWPASWRWWALLDLPVKEGKLSLLWDGQTLHATQPVQSHLPVQVVQQITALKTEEYDFDLQFEISTEIDGRSERHLLRPHFDPQT
jgi:hypothetical protein